MDVRPLQKVQSSSGMSVDGTSSWRSCVMLPRCAFRGKVLDSIAVNFMFLRFLATLSFGVKHLLSVLDQS